jgi:protein translocase SecG subunit
MLKQVWFVISIFLIFIIFLRMPQETIGLSSFANKSDILGSPTSAQKSLNYITVITVLIYFLLAFYFNLNIPNQ